MNLSKVIFVGFVVISSWVGGYSVMAADMPKGVVKFSEREGGTGDSCSLPTDKDGYYDMQYYGCKNDQMTYFQLDNVPSATTIRFESERCDGSTQEWNFEIKTIIHPITTRWVNLEELKSIPEGSVAVRGVVLVKKKTNTSVPIKGKLSCVRTKPSAQP
ncbi:MULTISPECIES: hypothetical protein [Pseudomonas]|uniref:hypothetical protein n=1 Tax=Pseudomonas TaxID=286 RepID=UPI00209EDE70|nr:MULTISPECIES: hypothetical protein [Pseudomonas]MCP1457447.1 hypothetical protein [Pseudomonas kilonensis]UVM60061.1 hypothetical protein LOY50_21310 [Pseudomonas sp. B21-010]